MPILSYSVHIALSLGAAGLHGSSRQELRTFRNLKFSVQSGARYDLKEDEVREVFSQYGELLKVGLYHKTKMGFDGFLGKKFFLLVI